MHHPHLEALISSHNLRVHLSSQHLQPYQLTTTPYLQHHALRPSPTTFLVFQPRQTNIMSSGWSSSAWSHKNDYAWFCSRCGTKNSLSTQHCTNPRCRKYCPDRDTDFLVNIPAEEEADMPVRRRPITEVILECFLYLWFLLKCCFVLFVFFCLYLPLWPGLIAWEITCWLFNIKDKY
jgi:hypothetical protein